MIAVEVLAQALPTVSRMTSGGPLSESDIEVEGGDLALLANPVGTISKARGMTQVAYDTGLSRESL